MKQINWKYYFVLLLLLLVLLKVTSYMMFLEAMALLMVYLAWVLFSGSIFYTYNKKRGVRKGFCTNYEYEVLTMHFWIDAVHKELAVICMLNPFKVQYFPLDSVEKIEPMVSTGKRKDYAYGVYFDITISGKKTSVGVASSGRGPFINMDYKNRCLEDIQKFKDAIWEAKASQ
ncbi:MAG: hypothetical protein HDR05_06330 [Lachnospiraceae bacterium]|nr:hypothetical protein [Lachnospiraceae bacterium]